MFISLPRTSSLGELLLNTITITTWPSCDHHKYHVTIMWPSQLPRDHHNHHVIIMWPSQAPRDRHNHHVIIMWPSQAPRDRHNHHVTIMWPSQLPCDHHNYHVTIMWPSQPPRDQRTNHVIMNHLLSFCLELQHVSCSDWWLPIKLRFKFTGGETPLMRFYGHSEEEKDSLLPERIIF